MKTRPTPMVWILIAIALIEAGFHHPASAQLTITNPNSAPAVKTQPFRAASHRMPPLLDAEMVSPESLTQIRVRIQYLMVDVETRKAIYAGLPAESVTHLVSATDKGQLPPVNFFPDDGFAADDVQTRMVRPSHSTYCVLKVADVDSIINQVNASPGSTLRRTPSVTVLDGKSAEMNDLTQRPFVVSFETGKNGQAGQPTIQLFDEGFQVRVRVRHLAETSEFDLAAELSCSRITDVSAETVFGIEDDSIEIQMPTHSIQRVGVSKTLAAGEILMIDPYYATRQQVQQTTPVPMLGRLPYVGQHFRNRSDVEVKQYLLAVLQPELLSR